MFTISKYLLRTIQTNIYQNLIFFAVHVSLICTLSDEWKWNVILNREYYYNSLLSIIKQHDDIQTAAGDRFTNPVMEGIIIKSRSKKRDNESSYIPIKSERATRQTYVFPHAYGRLKSFRHIYTYAYTSRVRFAPTK